ALDVSEKQYFNSGVLVMNLDKFRENKIEDDFYNWVNSYNFGTVAPDQDYLNCICKDSVVYLDKGWNKMPMGEKLDDDKLYLIHYNMFMKPWKYKNTMFSEYFWKYAKQTKYNNELLHKQKNYSDEYKINDKNAYDNLVKMALDIANSDNTYKKIILKK
ncbi:MAG: glycosyltransferase, partial [Clostridia bacterium]|nr:glycosyltransferase [Clostridia bacterium]